jgi:hypothetical protein
MKKTEETTEQQPEIKKLTARERQAAVADELKTVKPLTEYSEMAKREIYSVARSLEGSYPQPKDIEISGRFISEALAKTPKNKELKALAHRFNEGMNRFLVWQILRIMNHGGSYKDLLDLPSSLQEMKITFWPQPLPPTHEELAQICINGTVPELCEYAFKAAEKFHSLDPRHTTIKNRWHHLRAATPEDTEEQRGVKLAARILALKARDGQADMLNWTPKPYRNIRTGKVVPV